MLLIREGLTVNCRVVMFAAAPVFCVERRLVQSDYVNGAYTLLSASATQFVSSLPFIFVCAIVYSALYCWLQRSFPCVRLRRLHGICSHAGDGGHCFDYC